MKISILALNRDFFQLMNVTNNKFLNDEYRVCDRYLHAC